MNNTPQLFENTISMTTVEIAEMTGKRHDNVMRDSKRMLLELHGEKGLLIYEESYIHSQNNQKYSCYKLPKREVLILVSGYSILLRAAIIDRLDELENQNNFKMLPDFTKPAIAAKAWAEQFELKEIALKEKEFITQELDEAVRTKAHINNKMTATSMANNSHYSRKANIATKKLNIFIDESGLSKADYYLAPKDIVWLDDFFCILSEEFFDDFEHELKGRSVAMGIPRQRRIEGYDDQTWGYHHKVINSFEKSLSRFPELLCEYRIDKAI